MSDQEMYENIPSSPISPSNSTPIGENPSPSFRDIDSLLVSSDDEIMAPPKSLKRKAAASDVTSTDKAQDGPTPKKPKGTPRTPRMKADDRVRKAPTQIADSLPIPKSVEDFSEADHMMWNMRKAGSGWSEIVDEWERMTGQRPASTTLPNRFTRMKENLGDFGEEDDALLAKCKKELEATFAREIWAMISEQMVIKGGNKWTPASLEKRFKTLNGGVVKVEGDGEGA